MIHSGANPPSASISFILCEVKSEKGLYFVLSGSGWPLPGRFSNSPRAIDSEMRSSTTRSIAPLDLCFLLLVRFSKKGYIFVSVAIM